MHCGKLCLRPRKGSAQALPGPTRHGANPPPAAPLEASPGSPQSHGHQLSTYFLGESCSWPGTPSAEPQRRFPVIRRFASMAAKGACSSGPRRGACTAFQTQFPVLLHTQPGAAAESTGLHRALSAPHSQGPARGGECQGLCSWRLRAPDTRQPLTSTPDGTAGRLRKAQALHTAPKAQQALGKPL